MASSVVPVLPAWGLPSDMRALVPVPWLMTVDSTWLTPSATSGSITFLQSADGISISVPSLACTLCRMIGLQCTPRFANVA